MRETILLAEETLPISRSQISNKSCDVIITSAFTQGNYFSGFFPFSFSTQLFVMFYQFIKIIFAFPLLYAEIQLLIVVDSLDESLVLQPH